MIRRPQVDDLLPVHLVADPAVKIRPVRLEDRPGNEQPRPGLPGQADGRVETFVGVDAAQEEEKILLGGLKGVVRQVQAVGDQVQAGMPLQLPGLKGAHRHQVHLGETEEVVPFHGEQRRVNGDGQGRGRGQGPETRGGLQVRVNHLRRLLPETGEGVGQVEVLGKLVRRPEGV